MLQTSASSGYHLTQLGMAQLCCCSAVVSGTLVCTLAAATCHGPTLVILCFGQLGQQASITDGDLCSWWSCHPTVNSWFGWSSPDEIIKAPASRIQHHLAIRHTSAVHCWAGKLRLSLCSVQLWPGWAERPTCCYQLGHHTRTNCGLFLVRQSRQTVQMVWVLFCSFCPCFANFWPNLSCFYLIIFWVANTLLLIASYQLLLVAFTYTQTPSLFNYHNTGIL